MLLEMLELDPLTKLNIYITNVIQTFLEILSNNKQFQYGKTEIPEISPKIRHKEEHQNSMNLLEVLEVSKLDGLKICWDRDLAQKILENEWENWCIMVLLLTWNTALLL